MSLWVIVDDSIAVDELLAGAGAAASAALLAGLVTHQAATRFRMRAGWLVPALSLPGQVARDMVIVFAALGRRLLRGEQPPSGFREIPACSGGTSNEDVTRRVLLIGGRSVAAGRREPPAGSTPGSRRPWPAHHASGRAGAPCDAHQG
jgi:hypothetical protein